MRRRGLTLGLCTALSAAAIALSGAAPASAATSHQQWQVGFSFNCDNASFCLSNPMFGGLGGFWGWYAFYSDGTGDATLTGCSHGAGGSGAGHENVDIEAWHVDSGTGDFVIDSSTPSDAEGDTGMPAAPGHYSMHPAPGVSGSITVKLNPTA